MLSTKRIARRYGDNICRRCINRVYHARLKNQDCVYGYYYNCPRCKQPHHIVIGFTASGKLKMLLK